MEITIDTIFIKICFIYKSFIVVAVCCLAAAVCRCCRRCCFDTYIRFPYTNISCVFSLCLFIFSLFMHTFIYIYIYLVRVWCYAVCIHSVHVHVHFRSFTLHFFWFLFFYFVFALCQCHLTSATRDRNARDGMSVFCVSRVVTIVCHGYDDEEEEGKNSNNNNKKKHTTLFAYKYSLFEWCFTYICEHSLLTEKCHACTYCVYTYQFDDVWRRVSTHSNFQPSTPRATLHARENERHTHTSINTHDSATQPKQMKNIWVSLFVLQLCRSFSCLLCLFMWFRHTACLCIYRREIDTSRAESNIKKKEEERKTHSQAQCTRALICICVKHSNKSKEKKSVLSSVCVLLLLLFGWNFGLTPQTSVTITAHAHTYIYMQMACACAYERFKWKWRRRRSKSSEKNK